MLTASNFNEYRTIAHSAVAFQNKNDKVLAPGLRNCRMPKDVLRGSGLYAPRVDKYTPVRIQLLLELIGEYFQTHEQMLTSRPVEISRIMGPKDTISRDQVTIMD